MAIYEVYHTTENRGNIEELLLEEGVLADSTDLFLGRGYYYWENNYDQAVVWGQKRYNGHFYVFTGFLEFDLDRMFDITSRSHNILINKMFNKFKSQYRRISQTQEFYLGLFIDFVRDYQNDLYHKGLLTENEFFFSFLYSKGYDISGAKKHETSQFRRGVGSWYYHAPEVSFCVYEADSIMFTNFRHIKTSGEKQPARK